MDQPLRKPSLFFQEVDGDATLYVNGRSVGGSEKKRQPFSMDASGSLTKGKNVIAIRIDHRTMTELFLGGIIRPVLLIEQEP